MNELIRAFDKEFTQLDHDAVELVEAISTDEFFRRPLSTNSASAQSCGEQLLRSAGTVEQTFGGITANLWDDPFEWTLPETLTTRERILEYLSEVVATQKRGFDLLKSDADLMKKIMSPSGETQLMPLLLETLVRAAQYLGRARATLDFIRSENQ